MTNPPGAAGRPRMSRAIPFKPTGDNTRRRYAAGSRIKVPKTVRTVRDLLRQHMREGGMHQKDLAPVWNMRASTVKRLFYDKGRPLAPQYIDLFIERLSLDEFDAMELRWQGALEAGWQLEKRYFLEAK